MIVAGPSNKSFVFRFTIYMHKDDIISLYQFVSAFRLKALKFILFLNLFRIIFSSSKFNTNDDTVFCFTSLFVYTDFYKKTLIKENQGKAGVYRFVNLLNNKSYIGSRGAIFRQYFDIKRILRGTDKNRVIAKALIKYGYSNFRLEILEYCKAEGRLKREQLIH